MSNRQKQISIRLTKQEYDQLCKKAKAAYLKHEPYIRRCIEECNIKPRRPDEYLQLAKEISVVGKRINEIAHEVNRTWHISEAQMADLTLLLQEMLHMIKGELIE